ncbi:hypothetical protein [Actinokineospora xionganensis]|uniref:Uncharacterized protein n=1 Tax=Actinokineospora xionganensis TaxID=2684470 RepID=A0ABR7LCP6_9PSEU|nr:hypothetical protein [Actinokineospora xionganensis]MBC6450429.1 hypothetical protein [Actinokineospora xionganensis]
MFTDYFAAASDEAAAGAIDGPGGKFDTVQLKGLDPAVKLARLEALLTGRTLDQVIEDERSAAMIAMADDGERLVLTVTDELFTALAEADEAQLRSVVPAWSQTEEFALEGGADVELLIEDVVALSALARRASGRGEQMYCWLCV